MRGTWLSLQAWIAARLFVLVCGATVLAIGTCATTGYVLQIAQLYRWTTVAVGMAPNTALVAVLTGFALMVLAASNRVWKCTI